MDYERIYCELMQSARSRRALPRPHHEHHIIPRCLGGTDQPGNLVKLTIREHRLAHKLLAKFYWPPRKRPLLESIAYRMYKKSARSTVKERLENSKLTGCMRKEELARLATLWIKAPM